MFQVEEFIDGCRGALESDDPAGSVALILRDALRDRLDVAAGVREWKAKGGGEFGAIYRARDLTILHASVTPGFESPRHNHTMWAVIGVYEGQEDNTFYRRAEAGLEEIGRTAIAAGDAQVLAPDVIHRIANHQQVPLHAIHVYGGDLLGINRSMWDDGTDAERRFDFRGASDPGDDQLTDMVDFRACDADNHYYEATDAFTRHIEPSMAKRCMQWAELNGRSRLLVGGQVNDFIPNPTFDPVARPGSLQAFFKGAEQSGKDVKNLFGELEPIRPEYRQRDARLAVMDEQGIEATWLFPTLGVGMEQALLHDPEAIIAAFRAFNRWLDEDWGFAYRGRIFAAPYLSLVDLDRAVAELEWALSRGARIICVRTAPVTIANQTRSPFLEEFDAFWARVAEAGIVTAFHGGDTGYAHHVAAWEPAARGRAFFASPLQRVIAKNRAITETMAAAICHKVFDRHPRLRFAVVENGSAWLRDLLKKLDIAATQSGGWFQERPSDTFRRHVWVTPFWEDDPSEAAQIIGVERTLFGSDWPHAEGMAEPLDYAEAIASLGDRAVQRIMRDNFLELTS